MSVGGVLTALGPIAGLLITVLTLNHAFDASKSGSVPPEDKARNLGEGISNSMNFTVIGMAIGVAGVIVLLVSVVFFVRAGKPNEGGK